MEKGCLIYCYDVAAEVQRLTGLAQRHGFVITQTLTECPSTAPDRRTSLAAVRRMLGSGEVEALVVPSLAMLGGTVGEIVSYVHSLSSAKVELVAEAEQIDTTTSAGSYFIEAIQALALSQRAIRRHAARAGQLRAMAAGQRCGRPPISAKKIEQVRAELLAAKGAVRPTARKLGGISPSRVAAEKKAMGAADSTARAAVR